MERIKIGINTSRQKSTEQTSSLGSSNLYNTSRLKHALKSNDSKFTKKSKAKSKPKKIQKDENCLNDLIKTMEINLNMVLDVVKILKMNEKNENLIIKRIEIIKKIFNKYQSMRKAMMNAKSKNLVNNQIYGELNRRIKESDKLYKEKINDLNSVIQKKVIYLKKFQKKFNEIQIYIRSECQESYKYKKIYSDFFINTFILENESLIRYKQKLNEEISNKNSIITQLKNELIEMNINNKNVKDHNIKSNKFILTHNTKDTLNSYLMRRAEEIKYYEVLIGNLKLVQKNMLYEGIIILSTNNFFNDIDKMKNAININTDFSQDISNNDVSIIKKNYKEEIQETNMSNIYYELLSIESTTKSKNNLVKKK